MGSSFFRRGILLTAALMLISAGAGGQVASAAHQRGDGGAGLGQSGGTATTPKATETTTTPVVTFTTPTGTSPTKTSTTPVTTSPIPTKSAPPSKGLTLLQKALKLDLKRAGGSDSALVIDNTTGTALFSDKAGAMRLPASVEKLYTTTTALFALGPDARFTTSVLGTDAVGADGTYRGALYLRGGGDPTFGDQNFDRLMYGSGTGATIQQLVAGLKAAGIKTVYGPIVGDESYFDALHGGPDSGYKASTETEGELSGLSYDDGFISSAESELQPQPAFWAADALVTAMRAGGIKVPKGVKVKTGVTPTDATSLASVQSPPLSTLIQLTNSPSNDFFAETLLKDIGKRVSDTGSTAAGAAVVRNVIAQRVGLKPTVDDGSGLSRVDRTSATQIVTLLNDMRGNPSFYNSLAIAGVRGTMQEEMLHTRAVDNCRGKTGTLHDVANLVGYCTAANGDKLTFAFLMNGLHNSNVGHDIEDLMGEAVANYAP